MLDLILMIESPEKIDNSRAPPPPQKKNSAAESSILPFRIGFVNLIHYDSFC